MDPLLRLLFCLFWPVCLTAEVLKDHLQLYEGRWLGNFTIHSTATGHTRSFPVEQRYWFEGERLRGVAVWETERGLKTSTALTYIEGKNLISIVSRGDVEAIYFGLPVHQGILWVSSDLDQADQYQMMERVVEAEGERRLLSEGFDSRRQAEGDASIIYRGLLVRQGSVASDAE